MGMRIYHSDLLFPCRLCNWGTTTGTGAGSGAASRLLLRGLHFAGEFVALGVTDEAEDTIEDAAEEGTGATLTGILGDATGAEGTEGGTEGEGTDLGGETDGSAPEEREPREPGWAFVKAVECPPQKVIRMFALSAWQARWTAV